MKSMDDAKREGMIHSPQIQKDFLELKLEKHWRGKQKDDFPWTTAQGEKQSVTLGSYSLSGLDNICDFISHCTDKG